MGLCKSCGILIVLPMFWFRNYCPTNTKTWFHLKLRIYRLMYSLELDAFLGYSVHQGINNKFDFETKKILTFLKLNWGNVDSFNRNTTFDIDKLLTGWHLSIFMKINGMEFHVQLLKINTLRFSTIHDLFRIDEPTIKCYLQLRRNIMLSICSEMFHRHLNFIE